MKLTHGLLMISLLLLSFSYPHHSVAAKPKPTSSISSQLDINQADVNQLEKLKGIGKKKAEAIVQYRNEHGPFKSVEALQNVKGIGTRLMLSLKSQITAGQQHK